MVADYIVGCASKAVTYEEGIDLVILSVTGRGLAISGLFFLLGFISRFRLFFILPFIGRQDQLVGVSSGTVVHIKIIPEKQNLPDPLKVWTITQRSSRNHVEHVIVKPRRKGKSLMTAPKSILNAGHDRVYDPVEVRMFAAAFGRIELHVNTTLICALVPSTLRGCDVVDLHDGSSNPHIAGNGFDPVCTIDLIVGDVDIPIQHEILLFAMISNHDFCTI